MTLAEIFRNEGIEKGIAKGKEEGREEGIKRTLLKTNIKLLARKFGPLTAGFKAELENLDSITLEIILDSIFEFESLDEVKKYIPQ